MTIQDGHDRAKVARRAAGVQTRSGRFARGTKVKVRVGARVHDAEVIEERNGRVRVRIQMTGVDEPITTSYLAEELSLAS